VDFGVNESVVLDIGANRGGFAGNVLLRAPLARVFCFEPNPDLQGELQRKALKFGKHRGHPRCEVIEAAVGEQDCQAELMVTGLAAASSLLPVSETCLKGWPSADFSLVRRQQVQVRRLDNFLESKGIGKVQLLKLDVQGFELAALRGCSARLRDVRHIVCEVQFHSLYEGAPLWHEIVNFLKPYGFNPVVMDGFCFGPDGQPLQADLLLKR
jgi:FkbM family methyltransferase